MTAKDAVTINLPLWRKHVPKPIPRPSSTLWFNDKTAEMIESVHKVFVAFKEEIEGQIAVGDYEACYGLGVVYKEMLLLDLAIEEFKKALDDTKRMLDCCLMIAMCEEMKGNFFAAIEWLTRGIEHPNFSPISSIALRYDLALLLDRVGRHEEARARHQEVQAMDPRYKDGTD